jgi:formate dehydrogenase maturation protein FdhE
MKISEAERCPICGSGTLILQGRMLSGRMIRELVCILCKHSWRIDLPELRGSLRP